MARPIENVGLDDLWRAQLDIELRALDQFEELHEQVERKLDQLARDDERIARLRTIPGVTCRAMMRDGTEWKYPENTPAKEPIA